ncbi:MAG: SDR family NAD(P)-dependent oxidoreductase [SAR324 cluster bacterium]|nr:SDR family NAD(P)-dependent oxidoreductase [SAR324 cluster bacterium]
MKEQSGKLAINHGESLKQEANAPVCLSEILERAARDSEKGLVFVQRDGSELFQSYQELLEDALRILAGLRKQGVKPSDKIILQVEGAKDYIPAFWGCILGGFVPVPISVSPTYQEINSTVNKLHNAWKMLGKPLVLTSTNLANDISSLSTLLKIEDFVVETVDHLRANDPEGKMYLSQPDDLTLLLLTSGSTGLPKAVMLSHRNLLSMTYGTGQKFNFSNSDVVLNWMPLDHVGAIVCLMLMGVTHGCQQIHMSTEYILQNPLRWLDLIDQHRATISWAPNFAFALLNDRAKEIKRHSWDLSSMNFLINAGEQIATKTIRTCLKLLRSHGLPTHATRPAFGMSETCSGITFSEGFSLEASSDEMSFVELGPPINGASIRIADDQEQIVREGTVGRLQVRGPSVTSGYYQNPERNQEVFTEDGWFTTGDLGYLQDGLLVLTGREKDDIIIHGVNYYSHEIESVVEEIDGVETSYTAACSVRVADSKTDQLAIFFNSPLGQEGDIKNLMKKIRGTLVKSFGINPEYLIPVGKETIPKTAIGKIQRSLLIKSFDAGEFDDVLRRYGVHREKAISKKVDAIPDSDSGKELFDTMMQDTKEDAGGLFYKIAWESAAKESDFSPSSEDAGPWLIFKDNGGIGSQLAEQLKRQGENFIMVSARQSYGRVESNHFHLNPDQPSDFRRLIRDGLGTSPCRGIVFLWSLDEEGRLEPPQFEMSQRLGWGAVLLLVQALAQFEGSCATGLWIVTRGAQSLTPGDFLHPRLCQASLWGMGRVIPQEHSNLSCVLLDLDPSEDPNEVQRLLEEMRSAGRETQIAFRQGNRQVARLLRYYPEGSRHKVGVSGSSDKNAWIDPEKSYLITGGCGGLGLSVAQWMVEQGAKFLVLTSRRGWPQKPSIQTQKINAGQSNPATYQEAKDVIIRMEEKGARVFVMQGDVSNSDEMSRILEEIQNSMPPLRGIFHAAGVVNDAVLLQQDVDRFRQVMLPKVQGSWNLHNLTKNISLDFFVCFSSIASLFASAGKANYAAGNAFMDALMHFRRSIGLPGLSINWGPWAGIGMAAGLDQRLLDRWYEQGLGTIKPEKGLEALDQLLQQDLPQVLAMVADWSRFLRQFHESEQQSFFEAFQQEFDTASLAKESAFLEQLKAFPPEKRRSELAAHICRQTARVLNIETPEEIELQDSLFDMGMDSLTVVELTGSLETSLGLPLPATILFDYPTVDTLTDYLTDEILSSEHSNGPSAESDSAQNNFPPSEEVENLTEDELGTLLDEKLDKFDTWIDS